MKQDWHKFIPIWKKNLIYSAKNDPILSWLLEIGKNNDKILDQGCGIGQYDFTTRKLGFKNLVGLDFSKKLIQTARHFNRKLKTKIKFVLGDIRNMPFKEKTFDIVISAGVIEHVPETEKALSEISRVVKDRGYLLIHVPHMISIFTLTKKIQQLFGMWDTGYEKSFTIQGFSGLLNKNGFEILKFKIREIEPGTKHKILSKLLRIIDKPLYKIGLGGHHMFFLCRKVK
jgi:ubiquinone/menaquinone biosynthesis C-methylase UbiE